MAGNIIDTVRLRQLRELRGWSQNALAERAGISQSIISRLERGLQTNVDAAVLVALARALTVSVDALLSDPPVDHEYVVPELASAMGDLARLPEDDQRRVAAILRAYALMTPLTPPSE